MTSVTIDLPDELLARLDAHAELSGTDRTTLLRDLAEHQLRTRTPPMTDEQRRRRVAELLATASPHGGDAARLVREARDSR